MNKIPHKINLDDWECFGGGYTADSFYHKTDDSLMMKLYASFMGPEEGLHELEVSEALMQIDIPIAKPIEYVTTGTQYGAVFERLKGKRSIARIVADEPERLDEMAHIFAMEGKKLHNTKCDTKLFPDQADLLLKKIDKNQFLGLEVSSKAKAIINRTPKTDTCLHGDFQVGNMLIVNEKPIFIDLGDFAYGNPIYDLGAFYFQALGDPDTCFRLFHFSRDVMEKFWDRFAFYYFGRQVDKDELFDYAWLAAVTYVMKIGSYTPNLEGFIKENIDLV